MLSYFLFYFFAFTSSTAFLSTTLCVTFNSRLLLLILYKLLFSSKPGLELCTLFVVKRLIEQCTCCLKTLLHKAELHRNSKDVALSVVCVCVTDSMFANLVLGNRAIR